MKVKEGFAKIGYSEDDNDALLKIGHVFAWSIANTKRTDRYKKIKYGYYHDYKLVSCCMIVYTNNKEYDHLAKYADVCLFDVCTPYEHRRNGYCSKMLDEVMKLHKNESIYLALDELSMANFYAKYGFKTIEGKEYQMVKEKIK